MPHPSLSRPPVPGLALAIVTNNEDPDRRGRVRLRFPHLAEDHETTWAPVAAPYAGTGRGLYLLPEVDDRVLVAFLGGDPEQPVVIGGLWSGRQPLPCEPADGNGRKCLRTRSGFRMTWDDREGEESFEIVDPGGERSIRLDVGRGEIRIAASRGDLVLAAPDGAVRVECRDLEIEASGDASLAAGGEVTVDVARDATLAAGGRSAVSGKSLDLRGAAGARLRGRTVEITGDALLRQKAALVEIN